MRAVTHATAGLCTGFFVFKFFTDSNPLMIYLLFLGIFAAISPDFDFAFTKRGFRLGKFSVLSMLIPHRGPTHSILAAIISSGLVFLIFNKLAALTFFLAFMSHLILDSLNPLGVPFFWPSSMRTTGKIKYSILTDSVFTGSILLLTIILWVV